FLADLADQHFADADKIVLVQDNLNTHSPASLYATFEPEKARRIAEQYEWNYTPKHGSWLNMAEAELSVLSRQCLKDRIGSQEELAADTAAWSTERNKRQCIANWQFTNQDARVKLTKLYPSI
ncbi:MAG: transposase, partial [Sphingomonadales bacterium]